MKSTILKSLAVVGLAIGMVGCGQVAEVAPAEVGKIMTKNGYKEGVIPTSKFRLDWCWAYCDKLVTLNAADQSVTEKMELFMPRDKLMMTFDLRATLSVNPNDYEQVFAKVTPQPVTDQVYKIPLATVYNTYAKDIIRSEAREYLSQFTISEIASSRDAINKELSSRLAESIEKRTPFKVRYLGLADVGYPAIITQAQEKAAERREQIEQENAQLEISKVQLERELQEQEMRRKIEVEKARAEAEVNKIMGDSMTANYKVYRSFQIMEQMAESDNKVFMPVDMMQTVAGQMQLGK